MLKDRINRINDFIGGRIVRKFVIWIIVIIILLGALTTIFVQMSLTKTLSEELHERGQLISRSLAAGSVESILIEDTVNLHRLIEKIKKTENDVKYIFITDTQGKVLAHTFEGGFPVDLLEINSDPGGNSSLLRTDEGFIVDFSYPILEGRGGFVHIGMDETSMDEKISRTSHVIIYLTLIVGFLGVLMAYIAGNYLTRPIRALVKGTEEISNGNLGYQINAESNDEIHVLSKAFNRMSHNLKNSMDNLSASEERYKKLVDGISDAVIMIDSQKKILSWNSAAQSMFGYTFEELEGKKINILYSEKDINDKEKILDGEEVLVKKNGLTFPCAVRSKPIIWGQDLGHVVVIRDITEHKEMAKLEKQLLQSDKLATIGQLASGVAHEINNPIGNISLYSQMLLKKTNDNATAEKLTVINDEANRAARIVKGLLEFSRQSEPKLDHIDINKEINNVLDILDPQLKDIRITADLSPLPRIMADSGQIRQVLMNMLTNSIQAISTNGDITVRTKANLKYIEIKITDNGCGIPGENLSKIFDPFFTTKGTDGTGLGLSVCYGIIEHHKGTIDVDSEPGKTTFTIKLPVV